MKAVAIVSGGMDSVTLAHYIASQGVELELVSVDYGQRHVRELEYAEACARRLGAPWHRVDLSSITKLLSGSALTDPSVEVPEGHYADESMRSTVVPNRNAMLLDVATAIAVAGKATFVATAVHAGDHAVYPDCRPAFIEAYEHMARIANEGFCVDDFQVYAPFVNITKADIAVMGSTLPDGYVVPWAETWSCYQGRELHCGRCGTCVERVEAFRDAGVADPTEYE